MATTEKEYAGWGKPGLAKKFHYFNNSTTSICRRWWWPEASQNGALETGWDVHKENCAQCQKLRKKEIDADN